MKAFCLVLAAIVMTACGGVPSANSNTKEAATTSVPAPETCSGQIFTGTIYRVSRGPNIDFRLDAAGNTYTLLVSDNLWTAVDQVAGTGNAVTICGSKESSGDQTLIVLLGVEDSSEI